MRRVFLQISFLLLLSSSVLAQKASPLFSWTFFSQVGGGSESIKASYVHPDLIVTGLSRGSGIAVSDQAKLSGYWGGKGFSTDQNGPEDGIAKSKFISFSVSPNMDKSISFKEIKPIKMRIFSVGPVNYTFQYSLDGTSFTDIITLKVDRPEKQSDLLLPAINLADVKSLQNLSGKTVVFRIIPYGATKEGYSDFYVGSKFDVPSLVFTGIVK